MRKVILVVMMLVCNIVYAGEGELVYRTDPSDDGSQLSIYTKEDCKLNIPSGISFEAVGLSKYEISKDELMKCTKSELRDIATCISICQIYNLSNEMYDNYFELFIPKRFKVKENNEIRNRN